MKLSLALERVKELRIVVCLLLLASLAGCTTEYSAQLVKKSLTDTGLISTVRVNRQQNILLHPGSGLLVVRSESTFSRRLNGQVARRLVESLNQSFFQVELTDSSVSLADAFNLAKELNLSYMLVPRPVLYDDNTSSLEEWARQRPDAENRGYDKFYIQIALYDVLHQRVVDVAVIKAESGFFTAAKMPEELLAIAMEHYRQSIVAQNIVQL